MKELFGSVVVVVVVVGGWGEVLLDVDDDSMSSSDSLDRDELEFLKRIRIKSILKESKKVIEFSLTDSVIHCFKLDTETTWL